MIVKGQCKFCGQALEIEVDDDYAALGDRFNLLGMASCNRCTGLMEEKRKIAYAARRIALSLVADPRMDSQQREKLRAILTNVMKKWFRLVADYHDNPMVAFDEATVAAIMERPDTVGDVLNRCWML